MVLPLVQRAREIMSQRKNTKQMADYDPSDLLRIRAALKQTGVSQRERENIAYIVRLVVGEWASSLRLGEKTELREIKRRIEARYASTISQANIGYLDEETLGQLKVIFDTLNTPSLQTYVKTNRHGSPNRRLLIYLAIKRYVEAHNLPQLETPAT